MWQKQNELAMQAFVNGDSINAIRHWENAVAIAKEEALAPCPELAEIYYCLAKAQADSGDLRDAAENYQASVFQFEQSDPENQRLQSARYDLAQTLRKLNIDSDKATQLFQEALDLPASRPALSLAESIAAIRSLNFMEELDGAYLNSLYRKLSLEPDSPGSEAWRVLGTYYSDPDKGESRCRVDRFFLADNYQFDNQTILDRLALLSGEPGTLKKKKKKNISEEELPLWVIQFELENGAEVEKMVKETAALADVFNDAQELLKKPLRCCEIENPYACDVYNFHELVAPPDSHTDCQEANFPHYYMAYIIDVPTHKRLYDSGAMNFSILYS